MGSSGSDTGGCIIGEEGCPCNAQSQCFGELVCLSDLCVEAPSELPTTGVDDGGTTGPKPDVGNAGDTGDVACTSNLDCGPEEACADGACYDTDWLYFDTYVDYFEPASCVDGSGGAELFFRAYQGDELVLTSSQDVCPGAWIEESWHYDSLQALRVDFWERDAFFDDHLLGLCWQAADTCTRVPKTVLHDGRYEGTVEGHAVALTFEPTLY